MNLELHIERLVLDGIPIEIGERSHLQTAVTTELTRLLTANGLKQEFATSVNAPFLRANSIQLTNSISSQQLGKQIAQAVYSQLGYSDSVR